MRTTKERKSQKLLAIVYVILSILLIYGPKSLFAVCEVGENPMKCYWSTRAVIAIALILLVVAVLYFVVDSIQARFALSLTTIVAAAMVILIPAKLIGGCSMKTMACQSLTFPAFYVISAVFIISAIVEIAILRKESVENRKQELDDENR